MIVAIATPAAQAAITAAEGTGVTVLFTGVGEVSALGLEDGQKVTGVASPTPGEQPGGPGCPKRQRLADLGAAL